MKTIKKITLMLVILVLSTTMGLANNHLADNHLPRKANFPGGMALIPLDIQSSYPPKVYYNNRRVLVIKYQKRWTALVGIDLDTKLTPQHIRIRYGFSGTKWQSFHIRKKYYPLHHITIKDKSKVTPNPEEAKIIAQQHHLFNKLISTWTPKKHVPTRFIVPTKGYYSSAFGIRRLYNKVKPGRHTGLDIAAPIGTPINATAAGTVLATEDFALTGKTVFIDHGEGLISLYAHLHRIDVKPGMQVQQGEMIGTMGTTGRSTGPHLHWGVALNGSLINPMLFVPKKKSS